MSNHRTRQPIPVVTEESQPVIISVAQWLALYDAAYIAQVAIGIHLDTAGKVADPHYHAEAALREWAKRRNIPPHARDHENEIAEHCGVRGYTNLSCAWGPSREQYTAGSNGVTIYRIRELVTVGDDYDAEAFPEDVEDPAMEVPESNDTLGLSHEFSM